MDQLGKILTLTIGPWNLGQLLLALLFLVGSFILRQVLSSAVRNRLLTLAKRSETEADDLAIQAIISPLGAVLPVIGFFFATRILMTVHAEWIAVLDKVFRLTIILIVVWTAFKLVDALAVFLSEIAGRTSSKLDDQVVPLLRKGFKVFLGILALILIAQNLGYSVSGLLAGLGIGGLAVAMAAKDTLANFFGSLMILIDQPFHKGDWVTFPGGDGVIEEIGLRSTRIRTFAKTMVSVPNQFLANATVENHSLMPKRRIKFTLGVTYQSSVQQIKDLVEAIENYLHANEDIDQEFMLVKFTDFSSSSLDLFVYCFTVSTDWTKHLSVKQEVNFSVMKLVEDMGLSIAYPTQTVHLVSDQEGLQTAAD